MLYAPNRNTGTNGDPRGGVVAAFVLDAVDEKHQIISQFFTKLKQVRGMQFGEPDNRFLHFHQDAGGACFEWCVAVRVPVCTGGIAVHAVSIQGQPNQRKSGSRVIPMTAAADSVNEILAGCEYLWNQRKNPWRRLILRKAFTEEWTM